MATKNGLGFRSITATFTRPSDTNVYASGDLVANSTTAASVVPMSWVVPGKPVFQVPAIRLQKSGATVTNAQFRIHLFLTTTPTIATTGDNAAFASVVTGFGSWFGAYDGTMLGLADGGVCDCVPISGVIRPDLIATPGDLIYGLVEARAAYTPASAEVFVATLIQEFERP